MAKELFKAMGTQELQGSEKVSAIKLDTVENVNSGKNILLEDGLYSYLYQSSKQHRDQKVLLSLFGVKIHTGWMNYRKVR